MRLSLACDWIDQDDGMLSLVLRAERGDGMAVVQSFYAMPPQLVEFGQRLASFPTQLDDVVVLEAGFEGDDPSDYVRLKAFVWDVRGHAALEVLTRSNPNEGSRATAQIAMPMEVAALNRLGVGLTTWTAGDSAFAFSDESMEMQ